MPLIYINIVVAINVLTESVYRILIVTKKAIVEIFSVILQRIFCDSTLKKKKIRRYTDYLVWGGYFAVFNGVTYVLTYLGDAVHARNSFP